MAHLTDPLRVGATIGILGGGQLGRMLSVAASSAAFTRITAALMSKSTYSRKCA